MPFALLGIKAPASLIIRSICNSYSCSIFFFRSISFDQKEKAISQKWQWMFSAQVFHRITSVVMTFLHGSMIVFRPTMGKLKSYAQVLLAIFVKILCSLYIKEWLLMWLRGSTLSLSPDYKSLEFVVTTFLKGWMILSYIILEENIDQYNYST